MSTERAQAFLAALAADPALQRRLEGAQTRDQALEIMRASGYGDVTGQDLQAILPGKAEGELSDQQLETVAGGSGVNQFESLLYTLSRFLSPLV